MNKTTENKGITLIALVITIIVLLILAGLTLTFVLGENGLFGKARQAKIYTRKVEAQEYVVLKIEKIRINKLGNMNLKDILDDFKEQSKTDITVTEIKTSQQGKLDETISMPEGNPTEITVVVEKYKEFNFTIGEDCTIKKVCGINVEQWDGETIDTPIVKDELTASININNNKELTEGTIVTVSGSAESGISKVEIKIEELIIYSETITGKQKQYNKQISIDQIQNLGGIGFNSNNTVKLRITSRQGENKEVEVENVKNYIIVNAIQLQELATEVNNEETFQGKTIYQTENIDLESIQNWTAIGYFNDNTPKYFQGTYNGNNKNIANITINTSEDKTTGLFGELGTNGTVKNVRITSGTITQDTYGRAIGGIVGRNEGIIENCNNSATVTGIAQVGGIAGTSVGTVKDCTNTGNITSTQSITGGIAGKINAGKIESCKNSGTIISQGNPDNRGTTQGTGGIIGRCSIDTIIIKCANNGNVKATTGFFVGGICGLAEEDEIGRIAQCYNFNCFIEAYKNCAGGVIGRSNGKQINNCFNYFSSNDYYIKSTNGYNAGGVIGHITGSAKTTLNSCYNIGENILANENYGSILGSNGEDSRLTEIYNCYMLSTSSLNEIGYKYIEPSTINITKKSNAEFKQNADITTSVTYLLILDQTWRPWGQDANKIDGYPYLINAPEL